MTLDLKRAVFYTPRDVAEMFGKELPWVYRHSEGSGFLVPYSRRFGKQLFFVRAAIDGLTEDAETSP